MTSVFNIGNYKNIKILTIDEIKNKLNEFCFFKKWLINSNPGRKNIIVYKHEITNEIFVVKEFEKEQDFKVTKITLDAIESMDESCKSRFVRAILFPKAYIMEFWNSSVYYFIIDHFSKFSQRRQNFERSMIVYTAAKAVSCLLEKKLYYVDMKAENIFVRYDDFDPQKRLRYALGDLYADNDTHDYYYITYKPPLNVDKRSLVLWGILILIVQIWSMQPNSYHPFEFRTQPWKVLPILKPRMPDDIFLLIVDLYDNYNKKYSISETLNVLVKIRNIFKKQIDLYLSS